MDVVLVVLAIVAIAAGWNNGAIRAAGSLVGLGLGLWLGLALAPLVVGWMAGMGWGSVSAALGRRRRRHPRSAPPVSTRSPPPWRP